MRCLFLAPLKAPDHPVPSGERTMARLFMRLLASLGYEVVLASTLRSFCAQPGPAHWDGMRAAADEEVARLLAELRAGPAVACVFTYHVYYKAPDLIGPALARALGVPYVIAEPSRAPKRATGPFAQGHALAEAAIDAATLLLTPTAADREMLELHRPAPQRIVDLKPFLDLAQWPCVPVQRTMADASTTRLVTVAMMRHGDKLASYRQLGQALAGLAGDWTLDVVGDGAARPDVEAALAPLGGRVRYRGALTSHAALGAALAAADLFVWPGVNEAFGAVYLEAQAHSLPCVAGAYGGIADAVREGETALLTPPGDTGALRAAIAALMAAPARRHAMAQAAARFIATERTLPIAAAHVADAFDRAGIARPARAA